MLTVEFHCHTCYSPDSLTRPEDLLAACRKKGIDRVIITDHNTLRGAQAAQRLEPQRVILGEEIMTTRGELLAAFLQEEIPAGLTPQETIARLRAQNAFISVSHPFDVFRKGHWQWRDLLEILPHVDALETFNARCMRAHFNTQAADLAREYGLPATVGSDAHTTRELGAAALTLPHFDNAESLRAVIWQGQPHVRLLPPWVHLSSRWAKTVKRMKRDRG